MEKKRVGNWSALFGGPKPFEYEAKRANDFPARWSRQPGPLGAAITGAVEVHFDGLPGWLTPLWASDGQWLYIRRPEGVWRSEIPSDLPAKTPVFFVQRKLGETQDAGRARLGIGLAPTTGWTDHFMERCTPEDIDGLRDQARDRGGVEVDFYAPPLVDFKHENERLVVNVGDLFCAAPSFRLEGDWLIAEDARLERRCAFPLSGPGHEPAKKALARSNLWLRFEGRFLERFDVKVSCPNA